MRRAEAPLPIPPPGLFARIAQRPILVTAASDQVAPGYCIQ
jgi:hypothetical protein